VLSSGGGSKRLNPLEEEGGLNSSEVLATLFKLEREGVVRSLGKKENVSLGGPDASE
jgi:hypothetical protein